MSKPNLVYPGVPFKGERQVPGFQKPRGIFAEFPGATPKYARNNGARQDFRETMARMFILMTAAESAAFIDSFGSDVTTRALASMFAVNSNDGRGSREGGGGYIDFLLQSAQHSFSEKMAVHEVMSDNYVAYFFGQSAPTFTYSGVLLNTVQDDQAANMFRIYRDIIRGSQLAKRRKLLTMRYDDMYVSGAAYNFTTALNSADESYLQFSFSMLVKHVRIAPNTDSSATVVNDSAVTQEDLAELGSTVFAGSYGSGGRRERREGNAASLKDSKEAADAQNMSTDNPADLMSPLPPALPDPLEGGSSQPFVPAANSSFDPADAAAVPEMRLLYAGNLRRPTP